MRKDIARRRHLQQIKYNKNDSTVNAEKMSQSDKRKLLENNPLNEKIRENYKKVQEQINNIEVNIHDLLSKQEKNFLKSYQTHMNEIKTKFNELKAKEKNTSDHNSSGENAYQLEKQLKFFRDEAMRLGELVKLKNEEIERLKQL